MMDLMFALSPFFVMGVGALALMLAEAFSRNKGGLALGTTAAFVASGVFAAAVWAQGVEPTVAASLAPWVLVDRFALFFQMLRRLPAGAPP